MNQPILTTHTGSLPKSSNYLPLLLKWHFKIRYRKLTALVPEIFRVCLTRFPISFKLRHCFFLFFQCYLNPFITDDKMQAATRKEVNRCVKRQVEAGVAVVNDGEVSRLFFATYIVDRLSGFDTFTGKKEASGMGYSDVAAFPLALDEPTYRNLLFNASVTGGAPCCSSPITYRCAAPLTREIRNLRDACYECGADKCFMTASSPGLIEYYTVNSFYRTRKDYLYALADAMSHEYESICNAGLILQLDAPDLAMAKHGALKDLSVDEFREHIRLNIEVLNYATRNIDPANMRLHVCWGNYGFAHVHDVPLADIVDIVLLARPAGLALEGANCNHEHEWELWRKVKLPAHKYLILGAVATTETTKRVEHPEVVAQRLHRLALLIGSDRLLAGSDCGFSTLAAQDDGIAYAKLAALKRGAQLALVKVSSTM